LRPPLPTAQEQIARVDVELAQIAKGGARPAPQDVEGERHVTARFHAYPRDAPWSAMLQEHPICKR
jgi:hypothetical protein